MNKIIKNSACIIVFLFGIYFLSIGIYESYVASKNPYNDESLIIQLYAFTVIKAIINILYSILLLIGALKLFLKDAEEEEDKNRSNKSILSLEMGISIWGLVLWFNEKKNIPDNYKLYNNILDIEFYTFWIIIGIFILCIFGAGVLLCLNPK